MPHKPTVGQIIRYYVLPIIGAIAVILGIWFIIYLNKLDRRAAAKKADEEQGQAVGGAGAAGGAEVEGVSGDTPGGTQELSDLALGSNKNQDAAPGPSRQGSSSRRLGTTTTIETGSPRWS